jgi:hypothetical protein
MQKLTLTIVFLVCVSTLVFARKIEGQIISTRGIQDVVFNIPFRFLAKEPNYERLQFRVRYYDASGKLVTLKPDDADEIRFTVSNKEVRMLSRVNTIGGGNIFSNQANIFLRLEIDGPLKLFHYYYTQTSPGMYSGATGAMTGGYSYSVENLILQKGNGVLKQPRSLTFRKDMREYFSDCPQLTERIEARDFKRADMEAIVIYYNSNCAK